MRKGTPEMNKALKYSIKVRVNGREIITKVDSRLLLSSFLRENLELTGVHVGCDSSNCGACTVLIDGDSVKSCTVFAVQCDGSEITTIEGLSTNGNLHRLQIAFREKHGLQCGFCTPGMIIQGSWLLANKKAETEDQIREGISGNLCRCTGYQNIVDAIMYARDMVSERGDADGE